MGVGYQVKGNGHMDKTEASVTQLGLCPSQDPPWYLAYLHPDCLLPWSLPQPFFSI